MTRSPVDGVRVLAFDTFGTVTDWFTGISGAVRATIPGLDAGAFAREWRRRYGPILARVESGEIGWRRLDDLQTETLHEVADQFGVALTEAASTSLVRAWRTIPGWPDAAPGIRRLKGRFVVCALSNGTVALLTDMARHNGFDWDFVGGSDLWGHYKPARETYCGLAALFEVEPAEVMMVATHQGDLDAARSFGLRTAFVERPLEWGGEEKDDTGSADNDVHATDLCDLADQLGC
ncbi:MULTISPECIES: haloacid dehalogenase type II [Gordonia]|uniref:Haloacid dehalogenase type II n=2 Tax=Gordonia TaxID=2053 RepID=A0A9X3D6B0_9ACTN|nr:MULTISPECIES: haloacid dehalogenase type II [Gordonia]MCF3937138.1 haloacid dehalogenase type II [Gordonia tangerina]MCX2965738.1 haloacid dehalogenase type II [Gordonia aquimaris]